VGQKINPNGLRLGIIKEHRSRWFADTTKYPDLIREDYQIRHFITKNPLNLENLRKPGISDIRIERKADQIDLEIRTSRPGVIVGRGGAGIDVLIGEYIAEQLERRVSFRRVVRQAIQRAQRAGVEGIKIQVSGRLNGAEIARPEWTREGRVPLHTLRADIDYNYCKAQTIYGTLGIKTWVFKGEILPGQERVEEVASAATPPRRRGGGGGDGGNRRRQQFEDRSNEG
jgi:small subunit ribosomal protein S3